MNWEITNTTSDGHMYLLHMHFYSLIFTKLSKTFNTIWSYATMHARATTMIHFWRYPNCSVTSNKMNTIQNVSAIRLGALCMLSCHVCNAGWHFQKLTVMSSLELYQIVWKSSHSWIEIIWSLRARNSLFEIFTFCSLVTQTDLSPQQHCSILILVLARHKAWELRSCMQYLQISCLQVRASHTLIPVCTLWLDYWYVKWFHFGDKDFLQLFV